MRLRHLVIVMLTAMAPAVSLANGCIIVRPTSQLSLGLDNAHETAKGTWERGRHRFNFSLPIAIERNRISSTTDRMAGSHGDAAFADYLLMSSYSFRW